MEDLITRDQDVKLTCSIHERSLIGAQPQSSPCMSPGLLCASKAQLHICDGDCMAGKTKIFTTSQACSESSWCSANASSKSCHRAPPHQRGGGERQTAGGKFLFHLPTPETWMPSPHLQTPTRSSEAVCLANGELNSCPVADPVRGRRDLPPSWVQCSTFWYIEMMEFCLFIQSRDTRLHSLTRKYLHDLLSRAHSSNENPAAML